MTDEAASIATAGSKVPAVAEDRFKRPGLVLIIGIVLTVLLAAVFSGLVPPSQPGVDPSGISLFQVLTDKGCFTINESARLQDVLFAGLPFPVALLPSVGTVSLLPGSAAFRELPGSVVAWVAL
ncbi:MAG: hypothetical protein HYX75_08915 [Acidobacteria bacterium]|nr:hypothetical protein [Acidobacteriota bacterium]